MAADEETPSLWRQPTFIASAAFLLLVLALAIVMVVRGGSGPTATQSPSPSATPSQEAAAPSTGGCNTADTTQAVPVAAPAGVTWQVFNGAALPVSRTAGPLVIEEGVARCYAHTPVGALMAAAQISARYIFASDWRTVTERQVMPGPGRDAYLRLRGTKPGGPAAPGGLGQFAAFRFVTYSPQAAVVQFVMRYSTGQQASTVLTVRWDGDWKLELQPDGTPNPPPQQTTSLEGFTPWGGV
jgi:hypothetical protein